MSDWHVGDLALCVWRGPWLDANGEAFEGPAYGQLLIVHDVTIICCDRHAFLAFERYPRHCYYHENFRKVPPIEDPEDLLELAVLGSGLETAMQEERA
jgi:hypothetical protein